MNDIFLPLIGALASVFFMVFLLGTAVSFLGHSALDEDGHN